MHLIPASHRTLLATCAETRSLVVQTPSKNYSAIIVRAISCRQENTTLRDICDEDLKGQAPRWWNCPSAAATESYIQDTRTPSETPLASPPGVQKDSTTGSQGMEGTSLGGKDLQLILHILQTLPHMKPEDKHTHTRDNS